MEEKTHADYDFADRSRYYDWNTGRSCGNYHSAPGNKSGPAVKPGEQSSVRPDQSNVPGLPGSKSGPAQKPPKDQQSQ
jgi:hypothetical protein